MRKLWVILFFASFMLAAHAQEQAEPVKTDIITKKLEKVNQALSKRLDKINNKLQKKLLKLYPQLKDVNIDSLLESRITYPGSTGASDTVGLDSTSLVAPGQLTAFETQAMSKLDSMGLDDETLASINELKQQLTADLGKTPRGLDVHQNMSESLAKLGKMEELQKQLVLPEFPEMPELKLPATPDASQFKSALPQADLDKLKGQLTEVSTLFDEYKKGFEGWEEKLLNQVTSLEEVKLLQSQKKMMDAYKPLPEGYRDNLEGFQTNDFVKKRLEAKAEEIKKVGGKSLQEKFDEAQSKMADAKKKFESLNSLEDAPKRRPNPYKGDPFLKRIKLGGNLQVNRQAPTSIDAALQAAYLMNARARIGFGLSYRFVTQGKVNGVRTNDYVFSTRSFFDYTLFKNIYAEALYEWSNTEVRDRNDVSLGKQWVQSGMLGLGNRFSLAKKVQGNFTALYNFFHDERSPNPSPWVFRVGFEFLNNKKK